MSETERTLAEHVIDRDGNVWRIVRDGGMATRAVFQGAINIGIGTLEREHGPLTNLAARLAAVPARDDLAAKVKALAEALEAAAARWRTSVSEKAIGKREGLLVAAAAARALLADPEPDQEQP